MSLLCRIGIHDRDAALARFINRRWRSRCKECGAPCLRLAHRLWIGDHSRYRLNATDRT